MIDSLDRVCFDLPVRKFLHDEVAPMKTMFWIALKDLKLFSRDKVTLFFTLGFPIVMAVFFGKVFGAGSSPEERGKIKIILADEDQTEITRKVITTLKADERIDLSEKDQSTALDEIRRGQATGLVVLPKGFSKTAGVFWLPAPTVRLGFDPSKQAESGLIQAALMQSFGELADDRMQDPSSVKETMADSRRMLEQQSNMPLTTKLTLTTLYGLVETLSEQAQAAPATTNTDGSVEPGFKMEFVKFEELDVTRRVDPGSITALTQKLRSPWDISFPQSMMWGLLSCAAGFATLIVKERSMGTHVRLQASPVPSGAILTGKAIACFIATVIVASVLIFVGTALGMRPKRWDLLVLAIPAIGICYAGLMMILSRLGNTEQAVSETAWGVCTILAMLGGGMIPVAFQPAFMQKLGVISPVRWSVLALEGAIWRDFSMAEMLQPIGMLLLFGIGCGVAGILLKPKSQAA